MTLLYNNQGSRFRGFFSSPGLEVSKEVRVTNMPLLYQEAGNGPKTAKQTVRPRKWQWLLIKGIIAYIWEFVGQHVS